LQNTSFQEREREGGRGREGAGDRESLKLVHLISKNLFCAKHSAQSTFNALPLPLSSLGTQLYFHMLQPAVMIKEAVK
jgi:hypothetical protein